MRNPALEQKLCEAVSKHLVVRIKYSKDVYWRTFEPQAVYHSTVDHINVTGIQTKDANKLMKAPTREPRNFELAKITAIEVTDTEFRFDPNFDSKDKRFDNGLICFIKSIKTK